MSRDCLGCESPYLRSEPYDPQRDSTSALSPLSPTCAERTGGGVRCLLSVLVGFNGAEVPGI